ncbi:hypothetical protein, partial [Frankia sp. CpI1-P]
WVRSSVGALESGQRDLTAAEFILLPLVLTDALGRPIRISDLIDPGEMAALSPTLSMLGRSVLDVLAASPGPYNVRISGGPITGYLVKDNQGSRLVFGIVPTEAEAKAARRLKVPAVVVAEIALDLWGRSLPEERDRVVSEREDVGADLERLRAMRGQATRRLVDQIAKEIRKRGTRIGDGEDQD